MHMGMDIRRTTNQRSKNQKTYLVTKRMDLKPKITFKTQRFLTPMRAGFSLMKTDI